MTTSFGLLVLLSMGPQLGQSHQHVQPPSDAKPSEIDGSALMRRKKSSAESDGAYALDASAHAPGLVRSLAVDATGTVSQAFSERVASPIRKATATEPSEPSEHVDAVRLDSAGAVYRAFLERAASSIRKATASEPRVDTADLCGKTCAEVLKGGSPCRGMYVPPCGEEPEGFFIGASLYDICPHACPPEDSGKGSFAKVKLWVLLFFGLLVCVIGGLAYLFLVNGHSPGKMFAFSAGGSQSYESYEDDNDDNAEADDNNEEDDNDKEEADAGQSSTSGLPNAASSSYLRSTDQSFEGSSSMMPSGTSMMPDGASASTMAAGGANATSLMPGASGTVMVQSGTTMIPASSSILADSSSTMVSSVQEGKRYTIGVTTPSMMMGSSEMKDAGVMEYPTMMGSSVLEEQPR